MKVGLLAVFIILTISIIPMAAEYEGVVINEVLVSNASTNLDPDYFNFADWVEIYNSSDVLVDLLGCYISDESANPKKMRIRYNTIVEPRQWKLIWLDGNKTLDHLQLTLSGDSEIIGLYSPKGIPIDVVNNVPQGTDVSFGRFPDGGSDWMYYSVPTPNSSNNTEPFPYLDRSMAPRLSPEGGIYSGNVVVELASASPQAEIYYTLDGSNPTRLSIPYVLPIQLDSTKVVRSRIFESGKIPSEIVTQTFFVNDFRTLPMISLTIDPYYLYDDYIGIFVEGLNGIEKNCSEGPRNWNQDWERPVSVEMYEPDGTQEFRFNAGIKIFGGCSRQRDQKSFAIYLRKQYGENEFHYQLFPDKPITEYSSFILRNSGNDNGSTMFRDALMQRIIRDEMDVDTMAYRPGIVYVNGIYWGLYNIREKVNEAYLEENHGVDPDQIDMLQKDRNVIVGDAAAYTELISYLSENDLSPNENYEFVKTKIDVDEFINYMIAEIYCGNWDWPANNLKYWRPRTENGKWRWIFYDADYGFYHKEDGLAVNTLDLATAVDGGEKNPPWSTLLFRSLLMNQEFRETFIQRFASCFNTTFASERVLSIIDQIQKNIEPEMPDHIERWNAIPSMEKWNANIERLLLFAKYRPRLLRQYLQEKFSIEKTINVDLIVTAGKGTIYVNDIPQTDNELTASYYANIPIHLKAVPKPGYRFLYWEGFLGEFADSTVVTLSENATIKAVFEEGDTIVINEIHYNPSLEQGDGLGEFIELYNAGKVPVEMGGFSLTQAIQFTFPQGVWIMPDEYILVVKDAAWYDFPGTQVFQWDDGKLSNSGEEIRLQDRYGNPIDSVLYGSSIPWPVSPNGSGYTLSLSNPTRDNSDPENWFRSMELGGTPGAENQLGQGSTNVENWDYF